MGSEPVLVVGGGAAGLFCAGIARRRAIPVTVLERSARPARKVLITGKGRCNLTNHCTVEEFFPQVCTNSRFLYSALRGFSPQDTMALFEQLGVPLKTERGDRVFPVSDRAADVADALVRLCGEQNIRTNTRVKEVLAREGEVRGLLLEDGRELPARRVVLATGGLSYPATGSTGDGYRMAAALGHTVVPPRPALVPLVTRERWCGELMGLSLRNVTLTLYSPAGKVLFRELGEMLFTHFGVSGPLVLSASSHLSGELERYRMEIDLKPGLDAAQLDARLLRDFSEVPNRDFANALDKLLPRKLIPVAVRLSGIPPATKVNAITREQRRGFGALLKALPLTPKAFRPVEEAIVTAGGVSVKEVNPKTMESKLVKGLYFAGELLDVDAVTGGFNLQIAWSTGFAAANNF